MRSKAIRSAADYLYRMDPRVTRVFAFAGIILALFLSVWYLIHSYKQGNPKWIFLIMAFGIAVLLSQNLRSAGRRKD